MHIYEVSSLPEGPDVIEGIYTHVPVKMTSPGKSVVPDDKKLIVLATEKIMSEVDEFCTVRPFTLVDIWRAFGFGMSFNTGVNRQ